MLLPRLQQNQIHTRVLTDFRGLCRREPTGPGQWADMRNMTLAAGTPGPIRTRARRHRVRQLCGHDPTGLLAMCEHDGLVFVDAAGALCAGEGRLADFADPAVSAARQLVAMGAFVILWPDKRWANVEKLRRGETLAYGEDWGGLDAVFVQSDPVGVPGEGSDDFTLQPVEAWLGAVEQERWRERDAVRVELTDAAGTPLYGPPPEEAFPAHTGELIFSDEVPVLPYADGLLWVNTQYRPAGIFSLQYQRGRVPQVPIYPIGDDLVWAFEGYWLGWHTGDAPENPPDGCLWMDTSGQTPVLKHWYAQSKMWSPEPTYLKLTCGGLGGFRAGDTVTLKLPRILFDDERGAGGGLRTYYGYYENPNPAEQQTTITAAGADYVVVPGILPRTGWIPSYKGQLVRCALAAEAISGDEPRPEQMLWAMDPDELIRLIETAGSGSVPGPLTGSGRIMQLPYEKLSPVELRRAVPEMDYITECKNRLWGCRFGEQNGQTVNEIYASKLGDFRNWNSFQGLSTDAWAASRGVPGPWTGAATWNDYPLFFKQDAIEKVYVSASGAHQVVTVHAPGVASGCAAGTQVLGGLLYYVSERGVMVYDGSLPSQIGKELSPTRCSDAVSACVGGRYCVCMDLGGERGLFCFDAATGVWTREDEPAVTAMQGVAEGMYLLAGDGTLWFVGETAPGQGGRGHAWPGAARTEPEGPVSWRLVTGPMGYDGPERTYLLRLQLRMELGLGAEAEVLIRYDEDELWQPLALAGPRPTGAACLTLRPRRCDHFRLMLRGSGEMCLYTLTRQETPGSIEE